MIYFLLNEFRSAIKIGHSGSMAGVKLRVYSIKCSNVDKLILLAVHDGTRADEQSLHRQFKRFHRIREWFTDCPEIREYITSQFDFYADLKSRKLERHRTGAANKAQKAHEKWLKEQSRAKTDPELNVEVKRIKLEQPKSANHKSELDWEKTSSFKDSKNRRLLAQYIKLQKELETLKMVTPE